MELKEKLLYDNLIMDDLSIDNLSKHLKKMYDEFLPKPLGIHLFGIKFGGIIDSKENNLRKLVLKAGLSKSYTVELRKGVMLYPYVKIINFKNTMEEDNFKNVDSTIGDLSIEELSMHLKKMYNEFTHKSLGVHLFGIRYGKMLQAKKIKNEELIFLAGLPKSYPTELQKGIVLSQYVEERKTKIPTYWIGSANPKEYDHKSSFAENNGEIDWAQDNRYDKTEIGDIVFIYSGKPDQCVKYKCMVVQKDISITERIDDYKYWKKKEKYNDYQGLFIKFKLIKELNDERLSLKTLLTKGLNGPVQGPFKLAGNFLSLGHYINSIFEGSSNGIEEKESSFISNFEISGNGRNLIIFGTPGCGKSYYVNNTLLSDFPIKSDNTKERVFRTTFYQDYTNTDFIGQILPSIEFDKEGKEERVTYRFNPGPFALALKESVLNRDKEVALVIEELNRGNAPSIFGDIFQLLDRNKEGISEYAITNVNLRDYLNREIKGANFDKIKIPGNLSIYATMNTSDQNIFTLDTAFKRRWEFIKLRNQFENYTDGLGNEHNHPYKSYKVPGLDDITWETFVNAINEAIIGDLGERNSSINVSDKQIGIYFVDEKGLNQQNVDIKEDEKLEKFAYKIFSYLWDDVAKFDKDQLFKSNIITLDQLINEYIKGHTVFKNSIDKKLRKESDSSED